MHVLVIPTGIYPLPLRPLDCIFEQHQAEALQRAGLRVGVLSGGVITTRHLGRRFPYRRYDAVNGVPVFRSHRRAYLPARWEPPAVAAERNYQGLKPLFEEYASTYGLPDIIHAHNLTAGGRVAKRLSVDFAVPYVVTEHTGRYVSDPGAALHDRDALREVAVGAGALIAVGTHMGASLAEAFPGGTTIHVVPNVVDPSLLDSPLGPRRGPFTVAALGNLIPGKNYALLIRAFARAELPPESRLVIGGKGPERRRLAGTARSLGIADRVRLSGHLDRDQVVGLLRGAALFAHPSNSESFGVVLIEAMALGLPVLATASYGPQDIVTPDVGLMTPVGDVQAFADGLSAMFARRDDFDPETLRATCRERFGPEAFATRMSEIYRGVIG